MIDRETSENSQVDSTSTSSSRGQFVERIHSFLLGRLGPAATSRPKQVVSTGRVGNIVREPAFWLLAGFVMISAFAQINLLPMVGEEPRWARGAAQMLETGDWIVLRQQGQVFPERPPMTSWTMALASFVTGKLNITAVRLPSALAVVLTSLIVYWYCRSYVSSIGACFGGVVYATFLQVLQIGRHGESEAVFTLFLAGSLLCWHGLKMRGAGPFATWAVSAVFAALAALAKGPQAPIYLLAVSGMYMLVEGHLRFLFHWRSLAGLACGALVIASWQVPYYFMTDWQAVHDTWFGLAGDRFTIQGLLTHMVAYPLEIFACLLPWSPFLPALLFPSFRRRLGDAKYPVLFATLAIAVTFPTVWLAAGARGRYFMPLYPCFAVLIAIICERLIAASNRELDRRYLTWLNTSGGIICGTASLGLAGYIIFTAFNPAHDFAAILNLPVAILLLIACASTFACQLTALRGISSMRIRAASFGMAVIVTLLYVGPMLNHFNSEWHDPQSQVTELRRRIPTPNSIASFGPINHRFAYYFEDFIEELPWPESPSEVPDDVEYFLVMDYENDAEGKHPVGRGRYWKLVDDQLPFAWEPVGEVICDRRFKPGQAAHRVILGRRIREVAEQTRVGEVSAESQLK